MTTQPSPVPVSRPTVHTPQLQLDSLPKILAEDSRITVLAKGPSGTGKSALAFSFPDPIFACYSDPNRATVIAAMRSGKKIDARRVTSWLGQFARVIVPAVSNRIIPAETIVLDTIDFLFEAMLRDIKGTRSGLTQQDWGTVLDTATRDILALVDAAQPKRGAGGTVVHPGYNIVVTCHEKKITDEEGRVTEIAPAIKGAFQAQLEAFFDAVLICKKIEKAIPQKGAPALRVPVFQLWTTPPSAVETCKPLADAGWPRVFEVASGESGYAKLQLGAKALPVEEAVDQSPPTSEATTTNEKQEE